MSRRVSWRCARGMGTDVSGSVSPTGINLAVGRNRAEVPSNISADGEMFAQAILYRIRRPCRLHVPRSTQARCSPVMEVSYARRR